MKGNTSDNMEKIILIKYGELTTKKQNRNLFITNSQYIKSISTNKKYYNIPFKSIYPLTVK